jgi:predicted nucleic acid-binding protein
LDILIDFLRGNKGALELVQSLEGDYRLFTTVIISFDLHHGAWKTDNPAKNLQAVEAILSRLSVLSFTPEDSELAGKIFASLEKEGRPIGYRDVFIAATTMTHGSSLATRNSRHFERIPGLRLVEP